MGENRTGQNGAVYGSVARQDRVILLERRICQNKLLLWEEDQKLDMAVQEETEEKGMMRVRTCDDRPSTVCGVRPDAPPR